MLAHICKPLGARQETELTPGSFTRKNCHEKITYSAVGKTGSPRDRDSRTLLPPVRKDGQDGEVTPPSEARRMGMWRKSPLWADVAEALSPSPGHISPQMYPQLFSSQP